MTQKGACMRAGEQGRVCYYYGPRESVYERLGHAEVVQLELDPAQARSEFEQFADVGATPHLLMPPLALHAAWQGPIRDLRKG